MMMMMMLLVGELVVERLVERLVLWMMERHLLHREELIPMMRTKSSKKLLMEMKEDGIHPNQSGRRLKTCFGEMSYG